MPDSMEKVSGISMDRSRAPGGVWRYRIGGPASAEIKGDAEKAWRALLADDPIERRYGVILCKRPTFRTKRRRK